MKDVLDNNHLEPNAVYMGVRSALTETQNYYSTHISKNRMFLGAQVIQSILLIYKYLKVTKRSLS